MPARRACTCGDLAGLPDDPPRHELADREHVDLPQVCYSSPMDYRKFITIEPGKRGGKPCVRGLRITVSDVLEYLASGMSSEQILSDFPDLTADDIRACLAFAADRERKLYQIPA